MTMKHKIIKNPLIFPRPQYIILLPDKNINDI